MILFLELATLDHPGHIAYAVDENTGRRMPTWQPFEGPRYAGAATLLELLGPHLPRTQIVLTDWGMTWPNQRLHALLPPEILGRIMDVVWLRNREDYRSDLADLHGSIQFWLRHRMPGFAGRWVCACRQYHAWPERERHRLIHMGGLHSATLRPALEQAIAHAYEEVQHRTVPDGPR